MAPDPTASFREREAESIFASEPRVPRTGSTIFGESNAFVASRLRELWPRRSDQFHVVQKKIWKAIEPYDWKEVWAVEFNNKVLAMLNTVSCFYVGGVFRRAVKLTDSGFGALNVLMPSIVGSTLFGAFFHTQTALSPITCDIGDEHHSQAVLESTAAHLITSFWYPLIFTSVSAVYFASRLNTFPLPDDLVQSASSRRYILDTILRPALLKNRKGLLLNVVLNALAVAALTTMESRQLKMVHANLVTTLRQEAAELEGAQPLRKVYHG